MNNKDNGVKRDCPTDRGTAGRADDRDDTLESNVEENTLPREDAAETAKGCVGASPRHQDSTDPSPENTAASRSTRNSVLLADGGQVLDTLSKDGALKTALDLTNFQLSQLAIAVGEPKSGQEILEALNQLPHENQVTHGRLYPNLDALYEADLIDKRDRDRRTHEYPVTTQGRDLLSAYLDWLETALDGVEAAGPADDKVKRLSVELTHFQIACLAVLTSNAVNGQTVKDRLEDTYNYEIHHGRLYPNLDTLVDNGLVEKGRFDQRTNSYDLTAEGRSVLSRRLEWLGDQVDVDANGGDA